MAKYYVKIKKIEIFSPISINSLFFSYTYLCINAQILQIIPITKKQLSTDNN
jgi:hypothetical protein